MQISATVGRQLTDVYRNLEPNNSMRQDMQMMVLGKLCRKSVFGLSAFTIWPITDLLSFLLLHVMLILGTWFKKVRDGSGTLD